MGVPLAASDGGSAIGTTSSSTTAPQLRRISAGKRGPRGQLRPRWWDLLSVVRTLRPASYTGLDLNADAIAFCRKEAQSARAGFCPRRCRETYPLTMNLLRWWINVEASHGYPNFARFLTRRWPACCAPEGVSCTQISAVTPGFLPVGDSDGRRPDAAPLGEGHQCGGSARTGRGLAPRYLDLIGQHLPALLRPFGRLFVGLRQAR